MLTLDLMLRTRGAMKAFKQRKSKTRFVSQMSHSGLLWRVGEGVPGGRETGREFLKSSRWESKA